MPCELPGTIVGGFGTDLLHASLGFLDPCGDGTINFVPEITRLSDLSGAAASIVLSHAPTSTDQILLWDADGRRFGPTGTSRAFAPTIAPSGDRFAATVPTAQGDALTTFSLPDGQELGSFVDAADIDSPTWIGDERLAYVRETRIGDNEPRDIVVLDAPNGPGRTLSALIALTNPGPIEGNRNGLLAVSPAVQDDFRTHIVRVGDTSVAMLIAEIDGWRVLSWSEDGENLLIISPAGELGTVEVGMSPSSDLSVKRLRAVPRVPIFMATWVDRRP